MTVRVGVVDTGIAGVPVGARQWFASAAGGADGAVGGNEQGAVSAWADPREGEHGAQVAAIIRAHCPGAVLLDARAFVQGQPSSAARIAAALDWLLSERVDLVNLSFGLRMDRPVLALAIERLLDRGVICVASMPASGEPVYPAAYPRVVRVSGDARCAAGEFSLLNPAPARRFGAAVGGPVHRAHDPGGGASLACAHVSAALAGFIAAQGHARDCIESLERSCRWRGRECRS